ncbi:Arylsulfatase A [Devosia enhydra]|uniref:Arylsulfatase A n=1 Tax=Devosia enhydra TaxID=665118 RepID=A0A1K2HWL0_9HYPH|nr:sulfatase-like hydrolase/transferase [Devosia enhydra]SFZ83071.1 Arylsulfatase A [Devosia enhydra]
MSAHQPNIVVFLTDDHAQWALPCYGDPVIEAPALDCLARHGTVFENAFTATPVCSPARASFFTGLMPSQHGVHDFLQSQPQFDRPWLAGRETIATRLAAEGYDCAFIGKWHVGRDAEPQPGFSHWFALSGEYPIHHDGDNGFSRNGEILRETGNLTTILTRETLAWLDARDRARPFFLFVGLYATHSPFNAQPEKLVSRYRGSNFTRLDAGNPLPGLVNPESPGPSAEAQAEARAQYCAAVTHIDQSVGAVLDRLAGQGVLEDTLVVYTADHGLCLGQHGVWGKGNASRPQNMLDPSIRIPLLMAGPGIPKSRRERGFADHCDLHATLLEAAGAGPQPTSPGRSLLPILKGTAPEREIVFGEYGDLRMARDHQFKLLDWADGHRTLHAVGAGCDEIAPLPDTNTNAAVISSMAHAIGTHFAQGLTGTRVPERALAPLTYNRNQAWHPFVPPGQAPGRPA